MPIKFKNLGEKEVFKRDAMKLFGVPIWGGWLPYLGFRTMTISKEELSDITGMDIEEDVTFSPLTFEWFCRGASFGRVKVLPKVKAKGW